MPIFNARRNRYLYFWHVPNQIYYVFKICLHIFLWLDTFQFSVVQQPCVGKKTIKKSFSLSLKFYKVKHTSHKPTFIIRFLFPGNLLEVS